MTEGQIVLVAEGSQLRVGWVQTCKPGRPLRVQVQDRLIRLEKRELAAELHRLAPDLPTAMAWVETQKALVTPEQLEQVWRDLENQPLGPGELAERLLGADTDATRDTAILAAVLGHDGFVLAEGRLQRRNAADRQVLQAKRQEEAALDAQVASWRQLLAKHRQGLAVDVKFLQPRLENVVRGQVDLPIQHWLKLDGRQQKSEVLDAADLLRELQLWDGHEDVTLWRSGQLTPWPQEALDSIRELPDMPVNAPVLDLPFVAMDNDDPHEIDDAICAEQLADGTRLHVAVAHPAAWLEPESLADVEARKRGSTLYHPRHVMGMLPDLLARDLASLGLNQLRPALVVSVTIDAQGRPRDEQVQEAWIRVRHAWSYSQVERTLAGEPMPPEDRAHLQRLIDVGLRAEQARIQQGAWLLYRPDVDVHARPFAPVTLDPVQQTSPGRRLVTEAMVQASAAVGKLGALHQLVLPFRVQPRPQKAPLPPGIYTDAAECFSMFRVLEPGTLQVQPGAHGMMGVDAYVQVTSPLRRYTDLLAHRQLVAWLRGQPPVYAREALMTLAKQADDATRERKHWQRRGSHYFKLLWLASQSPTLTLPAQVVRILQGGDRLIFLANLAMDAQLSSRTLEPGDAIQVRLRHVHPERGQVEFVVV